MSKRSPGRRGTPLVITVGNEKGGVAKTSTVAALAEVAASRGIKVTAIDLDRNGTLTELLAPVDTNVAGSKDLLVGTAGLSLADCTIETGWPGVSLVQATALLGNREYSLAGEPGSESLLRDGIARDSGDAELVLIDTAPNRGRVTLTALVASDLVLAITNASTFAAQCVTDYTGDFLPLAQRYNPRLKLTGVLVTKYLARADERRVVAELETFYGEGVVLEPIPRREAIARVYEALHSTLGESKDKAARDVLDSYASQFDRITGGHFK